jgi:hypothetical protein
MARGSRLPNGEATRAWAAQHADRYGKQHLELGSYDGGDSLGGRKGRATRGEWGVEEGLLWSLARGRHDQSNVERLAGSRRPVAV